MILATADLERIVGINLILMFVPKVFVEKKDAPIDIPKHASMGINADFKKEMCVHIIIEITI